MREYMPPAGGATELDLAGIIETHKHELLDGWARRVLADPRVPAALRLSRPALYDHFPAIVDRIVATLRTRFDGRTSAEDVGKSVGDASEPKQHVQQRVDVAYSVPEVLRELSHLRLAILEACDEHGVPHDARSMAMLHSAFDEMMINAAEELSRLELDARARAEALAAERAGLYEVERAARCASEEAHRTKDLFLATVSHELRTPLNAILGWSSILRANPDDAAVRAKAIAAICRNADVQTRLIESVLDISSMTAGSMALRKDRLDMVEVVRAVVEAFRPELDRKALACDVALDVTDAVVVGDALRLHQVVTNLFANAVKFTPQGGSVRVRVGVEGDGAVVLEVVDSGEGIPPSFLPHVFESFRQADASVTRRHGGLGLGLAIAKTLVDLHGGAIDVASDGPGHGATLRVRLPRAE